MSNSLGKAFVTGGSGFVGRNLIGALIERGVIVSALARSDAAIAAVEAAGATAIRGDLDSLEAMRDGMTGCDVVFHAAAVVTLWGDPDYFHRINVRGTQNVIDAAKTAGVTRLVHVSTEAVLAGGKPIVDADETWPYPRKPAGLYPLTKGLAEQRVLAANSAQLTTVAVRPPLIWGRGDSSVLPQLIGAVRAGRWTWFDGGHYAHTTTHVANVVEGLLCAAERGRGGEVYFISDGETADFRDFISAYLNTQGVSPGDKSVPMWLARIVASGGEWAWRTFKLKGEPPLPCTVLYVMGQKLTVNDAKARRELGYEGRMTRQQGLAEMNAAAEIS